MKKGIIMGLVVCILIYSGVAPVSAEENSDFRIVGYYFEGFEDPIDKNVQFDKLSHIVYAFLIPSEDGSLVGVEYPEKLKELAEKGRSRDVKVLIGVGGWSYKDVPLDPVFEKMASEEESRKKFVENVVSFVEQYNLDGVDMDWEYPDPGESSRNYESLILDLSQALKERGKLLTAAMPGSSFKDKGLDAAEAVSDRCLEEFDWINIMGYDADNGPGHSPYSFSDTSIGYWIHRGVARDKIVIGVPFYARPSWKLYRELVAEDKANAYRDSVTSGPIPSYYNGINTIKEKTRLALNYGSGVMIWEINMDTTDDLSLLKAIYDTVQEARSMPRDEYQKKVCIIIDGEELVFEKEDNLGMPFIDNNNRMLVPVRKILEYIGADVEYAEANRTVFSVKDGVHIEIPIDMKYISVNGQRTDMDTSAVIVEGRTYLPLRYVLQGFGYNIEWHEGSRTVLANK